MDFPTESYEKNEILVIFIVTCVGIIVIIIVILFVCCKSPKENTSFRSTTPTIIWLSEISFRRFKAMKKYKATMKEQNSNMAEEELWIAKQLHEFKKKEQDHVLFNLKLWPMKTSTRKSRFRYSSSTCVMKKRKETSHSFRLTLENHTKRNLSETSIYTLSVSKHS